MICTNALNAIMLATIHLKWWERISKGNEYQPLDTWWCCCCCCCYFSQKCIIQTHAHCEMWSEIENHFFLSSFFLSYYKWEVEMILCTFFPNLSRGFSLPLASRSNGTLHFYLYFHLCVILTITKIYILTEWFEMPFFSADACFYASSLYRGSLDFFE